MWTFVFTSCRKSQDRERDLKLLLDMYKTVPKETREKAQVCSYHVLNLMQLKHDKLLLLLSKKA